MYIELKTSKGETETFYLENYLEKRDFLDDVKDTFGEPFGQCSIVDHDIPEDFFIETGELNGDLFEILRLVENNYLPLDAALGGYFELQIPVEYLADAYYGEYENWQEFAEEFAYGIGAISHGKPLEWPFSCIDWEEAADELKYSFSEVDGHFFTDNY